MKYHTYILLGPPGSGKSTEAKILGEKIGLHHIEIGSELRKVAALSSPLGALVNEIIYQKKELVPDGIVGDVLSQALEGVGNGILLDGAPRQVSQIDEIEDALKEYGRTIEKLIYLSLSQEDCIERISKRFLCESCKQAYKQGVDAEVETGICSFCQGTVAQRHDDTPEGVAKRYQVFHTQTVPVIEFFKEKGLAIEVSALGDPEEIADAIIKELNPA